MATTKSNYQKLTEISIKSKVERKGNLDYLSWANAWDCLLYTSPSPRDRQKSRMPSSA